MTGLSYEIKGIEELNRKLDNKELLAKPMKVLLSRAALAVERRAKIFSPVKWGRLRSSWAKGHPDSVTGMDISPIPMWSRVGTAVEYASLLEYSGKSPAPGAGPTERIPFFRPAISESKADIEEAMREARDMIERYWGS